jgi:hypothetical protein
MYNKAISYSITLNGEEQQMLTEILFEIKNWWFGAQVDESEEFERIESKHTRVHHDDDIYEIIRIH